MEVSLYNKYMRIKIIRQYDCKLTDIRIIRSHWGHNSDELGLVLVNIIIEIDVMATDPIVACHPERN